MIEKENFDFIVTPISDSYFLGFYYKTNPLIDYEDQRCFSYFMKLESNEMELNNGRFKNFDKHINDNNFSFFFSILEKPCHAVMMESVEWLNKHFSGKWNVKAHYNPIAFIMKIDFYFNESVVVPMFKLCNYNELYRYHHHV